MQHKLILILLILLNFTSYAQSVKITIHGRNDDKAFLFFLEGEKIFLIDSINTSGDDNFVYSFVPINDHSGFYRISFDSQKYLDFIIDNEDIEIEIDANNIIDSLKVIKSESNKIYYNFAKLTNTIKPKMSYFSLYLPDIHKKMNNIKKQMKNLSRSRKNIDTLLM